MLFDGPIEQRSAFGSENDLIATALRFELVEEFVARAAGTGRVASDFGVAAGSALKWVSSASRNGAASLGCGLSQRRRSRARQPTGRRPACRGS